MVETAAGVLIQRIGAASPLRADIARGPAAEEATQDAAALWGLPDFVYRPAVLPVGSGSRELGDRLMMVGDRGVVIQVKAREGTPGDDADERSWVEKHVARGLRQAHGTIRSLRRRRVPMTNGRGRTIDVDGQGLRWIAVVVVDHPNAPDEVVAAVADQPNPSVVLLRRDWEFLFEQLKSAHAVVGYLERVAGEPLELGTEIVRYFQLAQADEAAPPGPADLRLLGTGARHISSPLLPMRAAATDDTEASHLLIRMIFEDIAVSVAPQVTESERLRFLAALDGLPVGMRGLVGEFLLDAMEAVIKVPEGTTEWRQRRVAGQPEGGRTVQLAFGVCSTGHSTMIQDVFSWWVQLRHHEMYEVVAADGGTLTTVGVLLTPRHDSARPWDTTMIATSDDLGLDAEHIAAYRQMWPRKEE